MRGTQHFNICKLVTALKEYMGQFPAPAVFVMKKKPDIFAGKLGHLQLCLWCMFCFELTYRSFFLEVSHHQTPRDSIYRYYWAPMCVEGYIDRQWTKPLWRIWRGEPIFKNLIGSSHFTSFNYTFYIFQNYMFTMMLIRGTSPCSNQEVVLFRAKYICTYCTYYLSSHPKAFPKKWFL